MLCLQGHRHTDSCKTRTRCDLAAKMPKKMHAKSQEVGQAKKKHRLMRKQNGITYRAQALLGTLALLSSHSKTI